MKTKKLSEPMTISVELSSEPYRAAKTLNTNGLIRLQCAAWSATMQGWDSTVCVAEELTPQGDGTAMVNCKCNAPGEVGIFLVENKGGKEFLTRVPEIEQEKIPLEFRISDPYDTTINGDKEGFLSVIKTQIAEKYMLTEVANLKDADARPGSTIVSMNIQANSEEEANELATNYNDLVKLFEDGNVQLYDADGNLLTIEPQCISQDVCRTVVDPLPPEKTKEDKVTMYALVGVASAIVLFILAFCACALYHKYNKKNDKIKPIMVSAILRLGWPLLN